MPNADGAGRSRVARAVLTPIAAIFALLLPGCAATGSASWDFKRAIRQLVGEAL
jgi:hypothetical protein